MESRKIHKSKAQLSEERKAKAKTLIAAKSKTELELQTQIHNMAIKIQTRSAKHQTMKESKVSNRVKADRLSTHHQRLSRDMTLRPSDRGNDVRLYTKMDLNIWEYPDMRDWFNSGAPEGIEEKMSYKLRPHQTGYMIQL